VDGNGVQFLQGVLLERRIIMAICIECQEEYSDKRYKLGYRTCLECGGKEARKEINRRKKCLAPAFNKGAYQYITSKECVKDLYRNKT
jgi:hypothetical protein